MCGRFYIDDKVYKEIEQYINELNQLMKHKKLDPREYSDSPRPRDIYPTNFAPILMEGPSSGLDVSFQQWGFPNFSNKGVIINARAETALEKRTFKESVLHRRCVIPTTWFYEWTQSKEKVTFLPIDDKILFLAGFHNKFDGNDNFVILTTEANESMIEVHDRMPLIIERNQIEEWILDDKKTEEYLHKNNIQLKKRIEFEQQTLKFE
ncbi:MAG: hypothetical protein K0R15_2795 [Clostridiales bacterium]|jgi:putative SOS response-associated peptidase YedK|nr:hypothetical protein [Clostridiales bacterium]